MQTAPETVNSPQPEAVRVSTRSIVLIAVIFWVFPLLGILLGTFVDDLIVIYIAILLACSMHPVVSWSKKRGLPRTLTIAAIYLALAAIMIGVGLLAVPLFTQEATHLINQWPHYEQQINGPLARLGIHLSRGGGAVGVGTQLSGVVTALPAVAVNVTALLVNVVVILVLGFFFTADAYFAERLVAFVVPPRFRGRTIEILSEIGHRMGRWVLGQLGIVVYYGVAFSLGLTVLHVPYALSVGIVTAVLEIIPFVGGIVGLALALLVALSQSVGLLVPVIILCLIITNIEAHIIVPNLYGKAVQLHPATVIIGLLLGARAFGIVGALIAMPLAAALQVLVEQLYIKDVVLAAEAQDTAIPAFLLGPPAVLRWPIRRRIRRYRKQ